MNTREYGKCDSSYVHQNEPVRQNEFFFQNHNNRLHFLDSLSDQTKQTALLNIPSCKHRSAEHPIVQAQKRWTSHCASTEVLNIPSCKHRSSEHPIVQAQKFWTSHSASTEVLNIPSCKHRSSEHPILQAQKFWINFTVDSKLHAYHVMVIVN